MNDEFVQHGRKPEHLLKVLELAWKAGIPHSVAVDFVESSCKRDDVALAIVQQMFIERSLGPNLMQRIIDSAERAGFSYQDARDFSEVIITTKLAETLAAASPVIETCN